MSLLRDFALLFQRPDRAAYARVFGLLERVRRVDYLPLAEDRALLEQALAHRDWRVANEAVKLVGLLAIEELAPRVTEFLSDPRSVGFLRRNAAGVLGTFENLPEKDLLVLKAGLYDPYWEVRVESLGSVARFPHRLPDLEAAILPFLERRGGRWWRGWRERNFEVRQAACAALGRFARSKEAFATLSRACSDGSWPVRSAALEALVAVARRIEIDPAEVEWVFEHFDANAIGMVPRFPLQASYNKALRHWREAPALADALPDEARTE
jgi:hypothetical protein